MNFSHRENSVPVMNGLNQNLYRISPRTRPGLIRGSFMGLSAGVLIHGGGLYAGQQKGDTDIIRQKENKNKENLSYSSAYS